MHRADPEVSTVAAAWGLDRSALAWAGVDLGTKAMALARDSIRTNGIMVKVCALALSPR